MGAGDQDLLGYYQQELEYLRDRGAAFAQRFPKVSSG
jgi:type VI protein secretion system component VasA